MITLILTLILVGQVNAEEFRGAHPVILNRLWNDEISFEQAADLQSSLVTGNNLHSIAQCIYHYESEHRMRPEYAAKVCNELKKLREIKL